MVLMLIVCFLPSKIDDKSIDPIYEEYIKKHQHTTHKLYNPITEKYFFVDKNGKIVFDASKYSKFGRQYIGGKLDAWIDDKQAIIDEKGDYIVPPIYSKVSSYENGKFFAWKDTSWIFTDTSGHEYFTLPSNITPNSNFSKNGLAAVKEGRYYGFINTKGQLVIDTDFVQITEFDRFDITAVQTQEGKWGFINSKGEYVIPPELQSVMGFTRNRFEDEIELVQPNNKSGYAIVSRLTGKIIIDSLRACHKCPQFSDWLGVLKLNGKAGFIDKTGNVVVPFTFDDVDCFDSRGLAPAKKGKQWGFINKNGEFISKPDYVYLFGFKDDDFAIVSPFLTTVGMIDRTGKMVIPPKFYQFGTKRNSIRTDWELLLAQSKEGWGYIDRTGEYSIEPRFLEYSGEFHHRAYATARDSSFYFGIIDRSGNYIIEPMFDYLEFYQDADFLKYELGDKTGYFSLDQEHYHIYTKEAIEQLYRELLKERGLNWRPRR